MTVSATVLTPSTQLTASAAAIYTSQTRGTAVIKRAVFTNTDVVAQTITVYRVPNGGSATTANIVIDAYSLTAGQAYVASELSSMVLAGGDAIYAKASAGAVVNVTMSGFTS